MVAGFIDELLDFPSDIGESDEEENDKNKTLSLSSSSLPLLSKPNVFKPSGEDYSFSEFLKEDLPWLSNENAFPAVEGFDDILLGNLISSPKRQSPISVLDNCNSNNGGIKSIVSCYGSIYVPVRARSKRLRRSRSSFSYMSDTQQWRQWWGESKKKNNRRTVSAKNPSTTLTERKCTHCLSEKTPQWRAGPLGPKTLCNACGVRYKSGRLIPEYRPASSPTFSSELHSNSHKKILEMRRHKMKEFDRSEVGYGQFSPF